MTRPDPNTNPPQNTEETPQDAARRFAGQVIRAREAVRSGDWDALWAALGIRRELLPPMRSAEVLVGADWGLSTEQEIRAEALHCAVRLAAGGARVFHTLDDLLDQADDLAGYIRDGRPAAKQ